MRTERAPFADRQTSTSPRSNHGLGGSTRPRSHPRMRTCRHLGKSLLDQFEMTLAPEVLELEGNLPHWLSVER
jgi:hypothetical protein